MDEPRGGRGGTGRDGADRLRTIATPGAGYPHPRSTGWLPHGRGPSHLGAGSTGGDAPDVAYPPRSGQGHDHPFTPQRTAHLHRMRPRRRADHRRVQPRSPTGTTGAAWAAAAAERDAHPRAAGRRRVGLLLLPLTLAVAAGALLLPPRPAAAVPFRAHVETVRAGADRIAYYERGSGPPLVMAIGTGSTMAEWDPALVRLLARPPPHPVRPAGIGRSSPLRGRRTSFAAMADQTARFMRAIGVPRADVLGWSMGGFVAQQLAIRHPGSVRRLVLAGTNPGGRRSVLGPRWAQEIDSGADSDADALKVLYPRTRAGRAEGRAFLRRLVRASASGEIPDDFRVPAATLRAQVAAEDPWLRSDVNFTALAARAGAGPGGRRDAGRRRAAGERPRDRAPHPRRPPRPLPRRRPRVPLRRPRPVRPLRGRVPQAAGRGGDGRVTLTPARRPRPARAASPSRCPGRSRRTRPTCRSRSRCRRSTRSRPTMSAKLRSRSATSSGCSM